MHSRIYRIMEKNKYEKMIKKGNKIERITEDNVYNMVEYLGIDYVVDIPNEKMKEEIDWLVNIGNFKRTDKNTFIISEEAHKTYFKQMLEKLKKEIEKLEKENEIPLAESFNRYLIKNIVCDKFGFLFIEDENTLCDTNEMMEKIDEEYVVLNVYDYHY